MPDDALGDDDVTALVARLRRREVSAAELRAAVAGRLATVDPVLHGLGLDRTDAPVVGNPEGPLAGVPTLVKENTDVAGWPTTNGSAAYVPAPARAHAAVTQQLLGAGLDLVGTSRMPEFGLNATTEFVDVEPTRNPVDPAFSAGASSGGAAALVAAGAVPLAHANDGGESIRIPAAACGLVGLKPSRGALAPSAHGAMMPIDLVADGVVTRTVRDTALVLSAMTGRPRVEGPGRRLRVGVMLHSPAGGEVDADTRAAVERSAAVLDAAGHVVEPHRPAVGKGFVDDFLVYWGLLAFSVAAGGRTAFGRSFDRSRLDPLTRGLARHFLTTGPRRPGFLRRLRRVAYRAEFTHHDVLLSPVLAHRTPELGWLHPAVPFEELRERLVRYVGFTPLQNVAGAPAVAVPAGRDGRGLPVGVQLAGLPGDEARLLEVAYELEATRVPQRCALR
ncbi:amidase [Actinomycetospora termitidis]|uniref:Amidase n=1 Tax=Actinomycetospora termitidis TaxID=3053470 RepID=A0ABT7MIZ7_9PSEU|nr:amidase [Actinomycetospora sp. Odt1-22]MDL5159313.1 amidase [Actinomycetospora sp. Odt1-22]